jgi:type IV secretory pathway component VirB8
MDQETQQRLTLLEEKIEKIYISVEKTRKYFLWTMIISVALFVLPLIGLAFAIPAFLTNYVAPLQSLSQ